MSGQTLVFKIVESLDTGREEMRTYVFYDKNIYRFGVRSGIPSIKDKDQHHFYTTNLPYRKYSFYCDTEEEIVNFLSILYDSYQKLSLGLISCNDLPIDSDCIDFNKLYKSDTKHNEMVIYDYNQDKGCKAISGFSRYNETLTSMINAIKNVYNDY